jgi:hypothetical protein
MMNRVALLVVTLFLTSCSTMSKEECQTVNWKDKGFEDATEGNPVHLSKHTKACAEAHITPNRPLYMAGYNAGARQFCNYESGVRFGKTGRSTRSICNGPGQRQKFIRGYQKGKQVYDLNLQISSKESELYNLDKKIKKARKRSNATEVDHLYREKELINSLIASLRREILRIEQ